MNVLLRWTRLLSLVQTLNAKRLFWLLWARYFSILVHVKDCRAIIFWRATGFTMFSIIDHTLVSGVLRKVFSILGLFQENDFKALLFVFQWHIGKAAVVLPNHLRLMNRCRVTRGHMMKSQAGGDSKLGRGVNSVWIVGWCARCKRVLRTLIPSEQLPRKEMQPMDFSDIMNVILSFQIFFCFL